MWTRSAGSPGKPPRDECLALREQVGVRNRFAVRRGLRQQERAEVVGGFRTPQLFDGEVPLVRRHPRLTQRDTGPGYQGCHDGRAAPSSNR